MISLLQLLISSPIPLDRYLALTPPVTRIVQHGITAFDEEMPSTPSAEIVQAVDQAGLLASVVLTALAKSPRDGVKRVLADLQLSQDSLRELQPELALFFWQTPL